MKQDASRLYRFLVARFSATETFGLHLTLGMLAMLAAGWAFGEIAEDVVSHARITVLDASLAQYFHGYAGSRWTGFMLAVTNLHAPASVLVWSALLGIYFYRRHARDWLLTLIAAVPGGMVLNVLLKYAYHRTRPQFDHPLLTLNTYSFPSGHTVGATLFYGLLAAYLVGRVNGWAARVALCAAACALVALVGLSRIYLGAHYLSDVLGGVAEGAAWLAVCITAGSTLRRRRLARLPP